MIKISEDIYVGKNILKEAEKYFKDFDKILIFSNETVGELYFDKVKETFKDYEEANKNIFYFTIKDGEKYKNIDSIMPVYDFMIENNFSRKSLIVSLGGGVVCDMGGYIAATYMRGIEFIQIPTTLLAQVDASVGGKVAINNSQCKNMIGFFKQPYRVIVDVDFLKTLPEKEFKTGLGETIKYCFLTKDENFAEKLLKINFNNLENIEEVVAEAIKIKKYYVDIDPFEKKERAFLNFGHTYAHAIENFMNYEGISHGEAVSKGIIFDLELALLRGNIDESLLVETKKIFEKFKIDSNLLYMPSQKIFDLMKKDKKNSFENIVTIGIDRDKNLSKTNVSLEEVEKILNKYKNNFLRASIDIGTNSVRLFIAEVEGATASEQSVSSGELKNKKIILKRSILKLLDIVKLGEDVNKNKFLKEEAIERCIKALKKYRKIIDEFCIEDENIICFATSATRDSSNREDFIKRAREEANIKISCISGEDEASINFEGVNSSINTENNILVFDIGGGSTEFTLGDKKNIKEIKSLDIGSVRITEKFFMKNNSCDYSEENIILAEQWVKENLKELEAYKNYDFKMVGVAGTVTAQITVRDEIVEYDSEKIHLSKLTLGDLDKNLKLFLEKIQNNKNILGLEEKRRDVIIGGSVILKNIMKYFNKDFIIVSESDNLVGAILGGLEKKSE